MVHQCCAWFGVLTLRLGCFLGGNYPPAPPPGVAPSLAEPGVQGMGDHLQAIRLLDRGLEPPDLPLHNQIELTFLRGPPAPTTTTTFHL